MDRRASVCGGMKLSKHRLLSQRPCRLSRDRRQLSTRHWEGCPKKGPSRGGGCRFGWVCQITREGYGCPKFFAGKVFPASFDAAGKFFTDFPAARNAIPAKVCGIFRQGTSENGIRVKTQRVKTSKNFSEESNLPRRFRRYPEIL